MKVVRYERGGTAGIGVLVDDGVIPTPYSDLKALIHAGDEGKEVLARCVQRSAPVEDFRLLAPIADPGKILCSGINYRAHGNEVSNSTPSNPSFFGKFVTAVIGPGEPIVIPFSDAEVDWEVEMAFIVGKRARRVERSRALDHVFGYTVINDVSERTLQFGLQHEDIGKGMDSFCPMGPCVTLTDEIPDPSGLRVSTRVNGVLKQDASTSDLIFDVPAIIEFLSRYVTLEPGDVVSTGTPAGIGYFREPRERLRPGDEVTVEVERIGKLTNPVVAGW